MGRRCQYLPSTYVLILTALILCVAIAQGHPLTVGPTGRGFAGPGVPPIPDDAKFGKVYIRIDGADDELEKLEETFKASKAKVVGDIKTKPWGLRDLTVEDLDGVSDKRIPNKKKKPKLR